MMPGTGQRSSDVLTLFTRYGIYVVLAFLVILFSVSNERFFTVENLLLILQQASPLGIAVVGGATFVSVIVGVGSITIFLQRR